MILVTYQFMGIVCRCFEIGLIRFPVFCRRKTKGMSVFIPALAGVFWQGKTLTEIFPCNLLFLIAFDLNSAEDAGAVKVKDFVRIGRRRWTLVFHTAKH